MPLISAADQDRLRAIFADRLLNEVTITYFAPRESPLVVPGQAPNSGKETRLLLEELAGLTDRLRVEIKDFEAHRADAEARGMTRAPAFVVEGRAQGHVRFIGMPSGYEFTTLVEALLDVSSGETNLSDETREALTGLEQDVQIQVFVTPT